MKGVSEAKKFLKEGDEALKTGVFKWNKDYASAAINYDEAAKLFRLAKDYDMAIKVYEKCIEVNDKLNDPWAVARNYEAIVTMSTERTDIKPSADSLINWTTKSGTYFRMANSPNSYVSLVKKVAKFLDERGDLVEAMNLYKGLLNDLQDDEQHHLQTEIITTYAALLIKVQRYPECIDLFEREYNFKKNQAKSGSRQNLDTLALTLISLYLILGDIDKAEKRLQDFAIEIRDFIRSPEYDVSEKLLESYTEGNQADFDKNTQRSVLNNIFPLNIIKELRKVKVKAKARPEKTKPMDIDDVIRIKESDIDFPKNQEEPINYPNYANPSLDDEPKQTVSEDQKQKALDDLIC